MRKFVSLVFLAALSLVHFPPVKADAVDDCESLKTDGHRVLYALCIAEANAGNENAAEKIRDNKDKWHVDESCPCWDFEDVVQYISSNSLECLDPKLDTPDQNGADSVTFSNGGVSMTLSAGFVPWYEPGPNGVPVFSADAEVFPECAYFLNGSGTMLETDVDDDAVCRFDVIDLIYNPPAGDCILAAP